MIKFVMIFSTSSWFNRLYALMAAVPQFLSNDVVKLSGNIFLTISGLDPLDSLECIVIDYYE